MWSWLVLKVQFGRRLLSLLPGTRVLLSPLLTYIRKAFRKMLFLAFFDFNGERLKVHLMDILQHQGWRAKSKLTSHNATQEDYFIQCLEDELGSTVHLDSYTVYVQLSHTIFTNVTDGNMWRHVFAFPKNQLDGLCSHPGLITQVRKACTSHSLSHTQHYVIQWHVRDLGETFRSHNTEDEDAPTSVSLRL